MATYYRTISNCPITLTDSNVTYPYIDDEDNSWYEKYGSYHSGIDIECTDVYSLCKSVVTYIGEDSDNGELKKVVIVQYDAERSLRYCHLTDVYVEAGDIIEDKLLIGKADKWCHFELLTATQTESVWPVRVGAKTYYKQDPELYADGTEELPGSGFEDCVVLTDEDVSAIDDDELDLEITDEMIDEFEDGKGDDE